VTTRRSDWPERLADYVASKRETEFEWGTHDCCRFAAGAVEAMTGVDRMAGYRYKGEREALRLIAKAGSLGALAHRLLGEPLESVALAQRGDVVLADLENGASIGVCLGNVCAFAGLAGGVVFRPLLAAQVAWRIS